MSSIGIRLKPATGSSPRASAAARARSRSARRSGARHRPSTRCHGVSVAHGCQASPDPRWCATSANTRASCCTSTPRGWAGSGTSGKRILVDGVKRSPRAGWQHVHVAVDDRSRLAYSEVLPTDRRGDAPAFLDRPLGWFGEQGVTVEVVMTDSGSAYLSGAWRARCAERGLRHLRARPYTPRTNGKAERFIQILPRSWAYAFAYPTSGPGQAEPSSTR